MALLCAVIDSRAQSTVTYRLSFREAEHHFMDVEAIIPDLPADPLQLRISRSSPGRYAMHDFAKNVFDLRISDSAGQPLMFSHPTPYEWNVASHPSTVRLSYRLFGDRVDGTYLGVDRNHAHVNMPASIVFARGLDQRPIIVQFVPPSGSGWRVATQLIPGPDALTFTAANLQYLMDSPSELSAFTVRTFTIPDGGRTPVFRVTVHHTGTDADVDELTRDVQRIVREERSVFGEFPEFEGNTYTFLADYFPGDFGDGMEHRNSTSLTRPGSIRSDRGGIVASVAHEFFHTWNIERIRPRSLEPFNFDDVNMSGELWLGEGFTNYYGPLVQKRVGLIDLGGFVGRMGGALDAVVANPAHLVRSAQEMSELAVFEDSSFAQPNPQFISYYPWGEIIAMGLDLTLRERSEGRQTLDTFMRAMWERFGKGGRTAGYVDRPYTSDDVREVLASVSGDASFARDFFARYIQGHDVIDFATLLAPAGLRLTKAAPGRGYAGAVEVAQTPGGARVAAPVPFDSPLYRAGIDREDLVTSVGGVEVRSRDDFERAIDSHRPGDIVTMVVQRNARSVSVPVTLVENPHVRIVPVEQTGQSLTDAEKQFRDAWLSSAARNAF